MESSLNVDRSLAGVVDEVKHQLREDWGNLSDDSSGGSEQTVDDLLKLLDKGGTGEFYRRFGPVLGLTQDGKETPTSHVKLNKKVATIDEINSATAKGWAGKK